MSTPKGEGLAWVLIDYGIEFNLQWVVAIDATGEIWTFQNPVVRAQKNITQGRIKDGEEIRKCICKKTASASSENIL